LEVVDHDKAKASLPLEASTFSSDFGDGEGRRVVDVNRGFEEIAGSASHSLPLLFLELTGPQFLRIDPADSAQQALHHFFPAHLQGEDGYRVALAGNVERDIRR
jgi:hypothetical protein